MVVLKVNVGRRIPAPPERDAPILVHRQGIATRHAAKRMEARSGYVAVPRNAGSMKKSQSIQYSFQQVRANATPVSLLPELSQRLAAKRVNHLKHPKCGMPANGEPLDRYRCPLAFPHWDGCLPTLAGELARHPETVKQSLTVSDRHVPRSVMRLGPLSEVGIRMRVVDLARATTDPT